MATTWLKTLGVVALVSGGAGCAGEPEEAVARLAEVRAEGRRMDEQWDALEDRMLGTQARVLLWREMAARHQSVSALACQNMSSHVAAMQKHEEKEARKTRKKRYADRRLSHDSLVARERGVQTGRF